MSDKLTHFDSIVNDTQFSFYLYVKIEMICLIFDRSRMSTKRVNTTATARLKQDYMRIMKDPVPYVRAVPLPSNILEWYVYTVPYVRAVPLPSNILEWYVYIVMLASLKAYSCLIFWADNLTDIF